MVRKNFSFSLFVLILFWVEAGDAMRAVGSTVPFAQVTFLFVLLGLLMMIGRTATLGSEGKSEITRACGLLLVS